MTTRNTIYLSYSAEDERFASILGTDLRNAGINISLNPFEDGENRAKTKEALNECVALIAILSPGFLRSERCQYELSYANQVSCPIVPVSVNSIPRVELPREIDARRIVDFHEWPDGVHYGRKLKELLTRMYNITEMPKEILSEPIVEEPDFDALRPRAYGAKRSDPWEKRRAALERRLDQYRNANWWQWDTEKWTSFLEVNRVRREQEKDTYKEHEYERVLVEYGQWVIQHPEASESTRISAIMRLSAIQEIYWNLGEEPPDWLLQQSLLV